MSPTTYLRIKTSKCQSPIEYEVRIVEQMFSSFFIIFLILILILILII